MATECGNPAIRRLGAGLVGSLVVTLALMATAAKAQTMDAAPIEPENTPSSEIGREEARRLTEWIDRELEERARQVASAAEICADPPAGAPVLCDEVPPGRQAGEGNTDEYVLCVRPLPGRLGRRPLADRVCELTMGQALRALAYRNALGTCRRVHRVECRQVACETSCSLTVTKYYDQGVDYLEETRKCSSPEIRRLGLTAACALRNIEFNCDCACPCPPPVVP